MNKSIKSKCKKIKLVLTDVDGVLTDGGRYYSEKGEIVKRFHVRDGMGINILLRNGIKTAIITKENSKIVKKWAKEMNVSKTYSGIKIIAPAFYSLQDTKTPAKIGIYSMILNIILNLILMGPLQHGGLALATSLSALFNAVLLTYFLRKRLGLLGGRKILRATIKMSISASAMGIAIYFCKGS